MNTEHLDSLRARKRRHGIRQEVERRLWTWNQLFPRLTNRGCNSSGQALLKYSDTIAEIQPLLLKTQQSPNTSHQHNGLEQLVENITNLILGGI